MIPLNGMNHDQDSVMIALLPTTTDWCHIELPHMTLVYAGEKKDLNPGLFNELAKEASVISMLSTPITLKVVGVETFGDEEKVDVLKLRSNSELAAMRTAVEQWNASEFPFNAHVTIGPKGSANEDLPKSLTFDRIMVGWGEEHLTFLFKNSGGN